MDSINIFPCNACCNACNAFLQYFDIIIFIRSSVLLTMKIIQKLKLSIFPIFGLFIPIFYLFFLLANKSEQQNAWVFGYSKIKIGLILFSLFTIFFNLLIIIYIQKEDTWPSIRKRISLFLQTHFFSFLSLLSVLFVIFTLLLSIILLEKTIPAYLKYELSSPFILILSSLSLVLYAIITIKSINFPLHWTDLRDTFPKIINNILIILILLGAIFFFTIVLYTTLRRINYPFTLEWMEGGSLIQVVRILNGLPIYAEPSIDYVPYIYTPFYFYVSAFFVKVWGLGFLPLRIVSFLSNLGIAFIVAYLTFNQTKKYYWAIFTCGLYFSLFSITGFWFDLARVDMLAFFFLLLGIVLQTSEKRSRLILSGITFTCAIYTKQTFIIPIIILLIYYILFKRKNIIQIALPTLISSIVLLIAFERSSQDWFSFYVFSQSTSHSLNIWENILSKSFQILKPVVAMLLLTMFYFWDTFKNPGKDQKMGIFNLFMLAGLFIYSLLSKLNPGGYENVLLPFYTGLVITSGLGISIVFEKIWERKMTAPIVQLGITCLLILQFQQSNFSPLRQIPTENDKAAGDTLVNIIQSVPGDVFLSSASYLNLFAGKPTNAHWIAIMEFLGEFGDEGSETGKKLILDLQENIDAKKYDLIILDARPSAYQLSIPEDYSNFFSLDDHVFYPVTGSTTRPSLFYRLNK